MINSIITYIITFLIGCFLTSLIGLIPKLKAYREAILMMLQHDLTNLAFVCIDLGYIMDYQLKSWSNMKRVYKLLGGNDYIDALDEKIKQLPVKATGILQNN